MFFMYFDDDVVVVVINYFLHSFCTGHFAMVPLNLTFLHCLQHSLFDHFFNLYYCLYLLYNQNIFCQIDFMYHIDFFV